ncbi:MAG: hypothetical protein RSB23_00935 [Alistipes sp.]
MKYFVRSLKYFCRLCVICAVVLVLMSLTKMTTLSPADIVYILLHTSQGWILIGAALLLSAFYPRFGFISRKIEGDLQECRQTILDTFTTAGYVVVDGQAEELTFRCKNVFNRLHYLYEDEITVVQYGQWIVVSGQGKSVVRIERLLISKMK